MSEVQAFPLVHITPRDPLPDFFARNGWSEEQGRAWIEEKREAFRVAVAAGDFIPDEVVWFLEDDPHYKAVLDERQGLPWFQNMKTREGRVESREVQKKRKHLSNMLIAVDAAVTKGVPAP